MTVKWIILNSLGWWISINILQSRAFYASIKLSVKGRERDGTSKDMTGKSGHRLRAAYMTPLGKNTLEPVY